MEISNFIGNEYQRSSNATVAFHNPSTGHQIGRQPASDAIAVDQAVQAAKGAFPQWSATAPRERSQMLLEIARLIRCRAEALAKAETVNQGKPLWLSKSLDVPRAADNFAFFATAMEHWQQRCSQADSHSLDMTLQQPLGVVALIAPWNLPLYLLTWKIAPALAAGNTVVCKPSELTPVTAHILSDILVEAGLPPGVCNMVYGPGEPTGESLVQHQDVAAISFTGGTQTGRQIASVAGNHLKKVSLELGGKNPNIIFADCDFDTCLQTTIRSSFLNQGEICLCGSRVFVEHHVYQTFLDALTTKTRGLTVGDPLDEQTFVGPLVSAEHRDRVAGFIDNARQDGATIHCGGDVPRLAERFSGGYFLNPTIITDAHQDSAVMQQEIFGPVITVTPFQDLDHALEMANATNYGLSASIWTRDLSKAHQLARRLEVGQVWVNCWMKRDLRVPFGGAKASGIGREGGTHALDFYTETKNVCVAF